MKIPVGILGATGVVGQRFLALLEDHPYFDPVWLAASDRSAGKAYGATVRWRLRTPLPARFAGLTLQDAAPGNCPARVIFAALDSTAAAVLEPAFVAAGHVVVSNSSALRMVADVPLLVPEVNADHLGLIVHQAHYGRGGYAVTNPNCSAVGLVMALAPLQRAFGLQRVAVVTMQALSGAGCPGVPSLDSLANVIPYIGQEEEKLEQESQKILGMLQGRSITPASFIVSAQCNRVPVEDGHTECVSVQLASKASLEDVRQVMASFKGRPQELHLPSAPAHPLLLTDVPDRPQPRLDVDAGGNGLSRGMSVTVGRLRPCPLFDFKFVVLSHNTLRGAAGAAVLNGELLQAEGKL